jgi:hypothetical protein
MNAFTYASNPQGSTDAAEPSTDELLVRLAALRENIRRARQHYGIDERDSSSRDDRDSRGDAAQQ